MATDQYRDHEPVSLGEAAPTTTPKITPETREDDDTIAGSGEARGVGISRRRLFIARGGGLAVAVAGGTYLGRNIIFGGADDPTAESRNNNNAPGAVATKSPEQARVLRPEELTLGTITMPETLDAETYADVVHNVGAALQYAVNYGDQEAIGRYIPGGDVGVLLPDQFQQRAAFIAGWRSATPGDANDPNAPRFYAWGFDMEFLSLAQGDPTQHVKESTQTEFTANVRVKFGDLPPMTTSDARRPLIEPDVDYTTFATFTRLESVSPASEPVFLPDVNLAGRGWGISNLGQMYPIPSFMTGHNAPRGFETPRPVYHVPPNLQK